MGCQLFRGDTHNYSPRNNEDLSSNQVRSNMGENITHSIGAKFWDNNPKFITDISEETAFKKELIKLYGKKSNSISRYPLWKYMLVGAYFAS